MERQHLMKEQMLRSIGNDITKWVKEDGGYDYHLVSTIAEWIMVMFNQLIFLSFTWEFKFIKFEEPTIAILLQ
ncbi:hypothetical protein NQ315_010671 [Exocentrus adspersus]|uniref:Uncharacterized protein n=1 Tax=Exocentrus adspersus TaxID=1586481 RepID=A0AAV8W584_9CUCU|nr:hypothetical protein NQ315_010671 [Exocentrus adspersus]